MQSALDLLAQFSQANKTLVQKRAMLSSLNFALTKKSLILKPKALNFLLDGKQYNQLFLYKNKSNLTAR